MPYEVFVSHSAKDRKTADAIVSWLERAGIGCWVAPRDIPPGQDWRGSIMPGIRSCQILVFVATKSGVESRQAQKEVIHAVEAGLTVIPFRMEAVALPDNLDYELAGIHWFDATTPPVEVHLERLVAVLLHTLRAAPGQQTLRQNSWELSAVRPGDHTRVEPPTSNGEAGTGGGQRGARAKPRNRTGGPERFPGLSDAEELLARFGGRGNVLSWDGLDQGNGEATKRSSIIRARTAAIRVRSLAGATEVSHWPAFKGFEPDRDGPRPDSGFVRVEIPQDDSLLAFEWMLRGWRPWRRQKGPTASQVRDLATNVLRSVGGLANVAGAWESSGALLLNVLDPTRITRKARSSLRVQLLPNGEALAEFIPPDDLPQSLADEIGVRLPAAASGS